jgi:peptidoglycan/LPS O-acetylase OafA/YrhL
MKTPEIPALTGIRAVAAWWVVAYHLREILPKLFPLLRGPIHSLAESGYLGVDLFFVLSGFVIAYNYWERFTEFNSFEFKKFLWMRLARIYPVHCAALFVTGVLFLLVRLRNVSIASDLSNWNSVTFVQNLVLVHHWMPSAQMSWNYPAWSISCEWLAYLVFPALVLLLKNRLDRWNVPLIIILIAVQCLTVQAHVGNDLIRIATEFTAGVILWKIYRAQPPKRFVLPVAGTLLALTIVGHSLHCFADVWIILAFPFFIYGMTKESLLSRLLSRRSALYWGRASYSLYMFHAVVAMILGKLLPLPRLVNAPFSNRIGAVAVWLLAFAAVASFCHAFIEVPARRRMQAITERIDNPKPVGLALESWKKC